MAELTREMEAELEFVNRLTEDEIDTDDIPEAPRDNMLAGERGRYFRPTKTSVTIRLDSDLLDWFKTRAEAGGYQTEINRVLRRHMLEAVKSGG